LQRRYLRTDELLVVEVEQARNAAPKAGEQKRQEPDQPDIVTERGHTPRLIAGSAQARPERRALEYRHGGEREEEDGEGRVIERRRPRKADAERRRPCRYAHAVVAVGQIRPAICDAPQDLAERERDHQEADPGRAQRQYCENRGG